MREKEQTGGEKKKSMKERRMWQAEKRDEKRKGCDRGIKEMRSGNVVTGGEKRAQKRRGKDVTDGRKREQSRSRNDLRDGEKS